MKEEQKKKAKKLSVNLTTDQPIQVESSTSSINLKRNYKGETEITVKIYGNDSKKASKEASSLFDELRKKYPIED